MRIITYSLRDHEAAEVIMIKKVILALIILVVIIVGVYVYGYYQAQKMPDNNPNWFLQNRESFSDQKTVVCIGDSITHGRVSANYVDLVAGKLDTKRYVLVNAGINSELAYNVLQRLDEIIKCKPDFVTILIGTNDANGTMSEKNAARAVKDMKLPQKPTPEWYRENLTAIVKKLKAETEAKIALLSLPPIGEEIDSEAYQRTVKFSKIIREVSQAEGVTYLPLNERITKYLKEENQVPALTYEKGWMGVMYKGIFLHFLFGKSFDDLSESNGFLIVTDFLHLNNRGAEMVAELIEGFVRGR
jgi:lysophospholipase L1-like esterase